MVSAETQNFLRVRYRELGKILSDLSNELGQASRSSVMELESATLEQVDASVEIEKRIKSLQDFMYAGPTYTEWQEGI